MKQMQNIRNKKNIGHMVWDKHAITSLLLNVNRVIKFDSDDKLALNKMVEIPIIAIVVTAVLLKITNLICKFFDILL